MTLTTRLTLFFLSALGLVLTAFSITLYLLAHHHLHQQLHDRATATLATLMARAEIDPEGVEWELKNTKHPLPRESEYHYGAVFITDGDRLEGDAELEHYRDHSISEKNLYCLMFLQARNHLLVDPSDSLAMLVVNGS